jgi:hypothetical protein
MKVFKIILCLLVLMSSPVYLFADADPSNPVTVEECNFPEDMNCFRDGDIAKSGPINANFKAIFDGLKELSNRNFAYKHDVNDQYAKLYSKFNELSELISSLKNKLDMPYVLNGVPPGSVIMWSGTVSNIPTGWVLCIGSKGSPDLRNRFIVGKGNQFTGTGGSSTQTVHHYLQPHAHIVEIKAEKKGTGHESWARLGVAGIRMTDRAYEVEWTNASTNGFAKTTHTGDGSYKRYETIKTIPPYYALCFIMKL